MTYRNYHMCRTNLGNGRWRCDYCGTIGAVDEREGCTYEYEPCDACGGCEDSNECKPDCKGMLELLSRPDVYVAGKGIPE